MNASTDKILYLLKTRGPQSAAELGDQLQMTSMGARQHLMALESEGWVGFSDEARGRGRPVRLWHLTDQAWQRFPDTHGDLTLQLIDDIRQVFGDAGMEQLITRREQQMQARYESRLTQPALADRLMTLKALRTQEGYMADMSQEEDGSWLWWESHCPICSGCFAGCWRRPRWSGSSICWRGTAAASIASGRPAPERAERKNNKAGAGMPALLPSGRGCSRSSPLFPDKVERLMGLLTR